MKENEKEISKQNYLKESSSEIDFKKNHFESIFSISKSRLLSKLLKSFSKKEQNKYFDTMFSDLINFQITQENRDNPDIYLSNEISFINILYKLLAKNLIEIIYIINPSYREERIKKLYNWYKEQMNRFQDIKFIDKKSYNDIDSINDEEYFRKKLKQKKKDKNITEDILLKEEMSHRTQGPFDKKMLNQYKRVEVYNNPYYKKIQKKKFKESESEEPKFSLKSPVLNVNLSPPPPFKDRPVGDTSTFYSSCNGTNSFSLRKINENNFIERAEGGEKERTFYSRFDQGKKCLSPSPELNKEVKFSYSFNRPPVDYKLLSAEKIISENKNKLILEKRNKEEIIKKVEKYGIDRAHYKENILKKNELKNIINMYIETKKNKPNLINKRHKQKMIPSPSNKTTSISKNNTHMILTDRTDITTNTTYNSNDESPYLLIQKLNSQKIVHQLSKADDLIKNNPKNVFNFPKKERNDISLHTGRAMKRHYTLENLEISKKLRRMGNKVVVDEIKNINKKTNEIIDKPHEDIAFFDIKLKYEKDLIKKKLLKNKINSEKDNSKTPSDIVYKLIKEEPLFKQKLITDKLCNIKAKLNDKKFIRDPMDEDESIYHNFCLSAYNWKNMKIINKNKNNFENDVKILRHISPNSKNIGKKKLVDENDSFNNYKNNYLNLRKTIGEWKKYECEDLMNTINKNKDKDKDVVANKNNNKIKKEKILINAIINPNEYNNFPEYYLPKTGGNLLSKIEINVVKKKKNKK